ncbi:hypothetical protein SSX86_029959 [Deinandra increscens subsp. villosa]|uniref:Uncharacterized protein n=1 Tax=Deinandra increscens subsp. villosa TaxID=3103831 RepID=A0AAP0GL29_9ASTR
MCNPHSSTDKRFDWAHSDRSTISSRQRLSNKDLKEVTHKVYFDVKIVGKPASPDRLTSMLKLMRTSDIYMVWQEMLILVVVSTLADLSYVQYIEKEIKRVEKNSGVISRGSSNMVKITLPAEMICVFDFGHMHHGNEGQFSLAYATEMEKLPDLKPSESSKLKHCETIHRFKALNKKQAFNFESEKRAQHAPPIDLFNKLSLATESGSRSSRPPLIFTKVISSPSCDLKHSIFKAFTDLYVMLTTRVLKKTEYARFKAM